MTTLTNDRILEQRKELEEAQECVLSFDIENGMQLKNPIN